MKNRMNTIRIITTAAVTLAMSLLFCAMAQTERPPHPAGRPEGIPPHHARLSPKERATERTDEMNKVVSLDKKQYKKIYRIFLKEENAKVAAMENGRPAGFPPGGFPGGPGMSGGFEGGFGGGFPGGPPPGGFPGGPGAEGPVFGEPQKPTVGGKEIDSDEYIDRREEKFRKILSEEQYALWRKHCPDPTGFFIK